jgi:hypothetical protein
LTGAGSAGVAAPTINTRRTHIVPPRFSLKQGMAAWPYILGPVKGG